MRTMNRARMTIFAALAAVFLAAAGPALAAKSMLRYVGELLDSQGQPQNGTFLLRFRVWDSAQGGRAVWQQASYVSVLGGRFATSLGARKGLPAGTFSKGYRVTVEAPPGTGWSAKAVMPPALIGGAARPVKAAAPEPRPAATEAAAVSDAGVSAGDTEPAEEPTPALSGIQRDLARTKDEARRAKKEAEESRRRLDALEKSLREGGTPPAPTVKIYVVRGGDTLRSIAGRLFGDSERWMDLYQANYDRLRRGGELVPGQKLVVPPVGE